MSSEPIRTYSIEYTAIRAEQVDVKATCLEDAIARFHDNDFANEVSVTETIEERIIQVREV